MRFDLKWTESALEDLPLFRKYEQTLILDQVQVQLSYDPATETRHRKPLEPNDLGEWEVRIGAYRIFYVVDTTEATVKINEPGTYTTDQVQEKLDLTASAE